MKNSGRSISRESYNDNCQCEDWWRNEETQYHLLHYRSTLRGDAGLDEFEPISHRASFFPYLWQCVAVYQMITLKIASWSSGNLRVIVNEIVSKEKEVIWKSNKMFLRGWRNWSQWGRICNQQLLWRYRVDSDSVRMVSIEEPLAKGRFLFLRQSCKLLRQTLVLEFRTYTVFTNISRDHPVSSWYNIGNP